MEYASDSQETDCGRSADMQSDAKTRISQENLKTAQATNTDTIKTTQK